MLRAFVVPHAPLLLELPGRTHPAPEIAAAVSSLPVGDEVIVVTPHGGMAGIYSGSGGDLAGFGIPQARAEWRTDDALGRDLAEHWREGSIDGPPDHGAIVPLALLSCERAVVCALPQWTGQQEGDPADAVAAAQALAGAIEQLTRDRDVSLVVSAHTSAAITARAPLTERPEGKEVHQAIVSALEHGPARLGDIPLEKFRRAGSCGAGGWTLLGQLVTEPMEVVAEAAPFGVGYVVARTP